MVSLATRFFSNVFQVGKSKKNTKNKNTRLYKPRVYKRDLGVYKKNIIQKIKAEKPISQFQTLLRIHDMQKSVNLYRGYQYEIQTFVRQF